ncbi:toll/interleukin-1 receptor domain-containing protein [Shimia biformata]|uniref:toll/interleukin-1 receptor domain-containing protein n=1 Tax=Shimia biformata TaxID=1294299 RepID=UPI001EF2AC86|nr:toll/interleukin-1 receptor domain-containing protein [Shimia biformata]
MAARVFMSYSHKDEALRDELEVQLAMLKRQGLIDVWHDRRMVAGDRLDWTISKELDEADIVILLISPDFLASEYCYKIEKGRALERHREGTARLISVILRPCDWTHTDLAQFLVTPTDGKPITTWPNRDEAFLDVTNWIRGAIAEISAANEPQEVHEYIEQVASEAELVAELPRSSNLRLRKEFTEADKDRFLLNAFEYMDRFFQGSLEELQARNSGIETRHRKVDGNTFTATIYRDGTKDAACSIRLGGILGNVIAYSDGDEAPPNSYNESISVENDDQKLFLKPMGMPHFGLGQDNDALSEQGAAEYYWSLLIHPLQGD